VRTVFGTLNRRTSVVPAHHQLPRDPRRAVA
jgi:hypothetical protein